MTNEEIARDLVEMQGAGELLPEASLALINRIKSALNAKDEAATTAQAEAADAERIRIQAYLGFDTAYSDEFCVRCSHCPTNCECRNPVYMQGWQPSEELRAFKVALFQEYPYHIDERVAEARRGAFDEAIEIADSYGDSIGNPYKNIIDALRVAKEQKK